jgi:hypothetical protein
MPLAYVKPEEAFEVTQPSSGGRPLNLTVYHVYKGTNFPDPLVYWYTFDEAEGEDNEFDIRELPTWSTRAGVMGSLSERARFHESFLQEALDCGMVRIENNKLVILAGGE